MGSMEERYHFVYSDIKKDGFLQGVAPTDAILPGRPYKSASIWHMWKGIKAPCNSLIFRCIFFKTVYRSLPLPSFILDKTSYLS
jgi:hypothetical protein